MTVDDEEVLLMLLASSPLISPTVLEAEHPAYPQLGGVDELPYDGSELPYDGSELP